MSRVTLHEGDNQISLRRMIDQGVRVHSVVTDPPYGLTSIAKRFGADNAAPAKFGTDGAFARASAGFMGNTWDGTGIERDPEFWRLIYEILLPGGYVVAFSGSRTGHWQACAMETAGFVMHPMLGWVYGQGFPKAHSAGQAVEKLLTTGKARRPDRDLGGLPRNRWSGSEEGTLFSNTGGRIEPTTPEAQQWDGWAYGGQALKPALEPIYVGQKPFAEKNGALNLLKHGVGAINIDGCRVPHVTVNGGNLADNPHLRTTKERSAPVATNFGRAGDETLLTTPQGRHPANLLHDSSPEVIALFPQTPGQLARSSSSSSSSSEKRKTQNVYGEMDPRGDAGSAARFFNSFPLTDEDYAFAIEAGLIAEIDADPIRYQPKATKADRDGSKHPTVKPIDLKRWLVRMTTPPGGTVLDPFAGSGTTGVAAQREGFDCILMEAEPKYLVDLRRRFDISPPVVATFTDFDDLLGGEISNEALLG